MLQAELPRRTDLTVATRWGAGVEVALCLLLLVPFAAPLVSAARRRREPSARTAPPAGAA